MKYKNFPDATYRNRNNPPPNTHTKKPYKTLKVTESRVTGGIVDIVLRKDNQGDIPEGFPVALLRDTEKSPHNSRIKQDCQ